MPELNPGERRVLELVRDHPSSGVEDIVRWLTPAKDPEFDWFGVHNIVYNLRNMGLVRGHEPHEGAGYTLEVTEQGRRALAPPTLNIAPDYEGMHRIATVLQAQVMESGRLIERAGELLEAMNERGFDALHRPHFTLVLKALEALVEQEEQRIAAINAGLPVQKPQREDEMHLEAGGSITFFHGFQREYPVRFVICGAAVQITADEATWFSKQLALRANEEG